MEVSIRLLRYFVAVAEELHFTRAAERLHVAQPALSKAIRRLEGETGVELFARTRQSVALTAAGHALLPVARSVLGEFGDWLTEARGLRDAAARVFRVGYHAGLSPEVVGPVTAGFARLRPGLALDFRLGDWNDPAGRVLDGQVHAAILPLPLPHRELLEIEVIRRDRALVALPAGHRLAGRASVALADLRPEPFVALPAGTGPLRDSWLHAAEFGGPPEIAVEVDNPDDWFQAVQSGRGIAMLTELSARVYARAGIVYRPVEDARPGELGVVWRKGATDPVLRDFVRACLDAGVSGGLPGARR